VIRNNKDIIEKCTDVNLGSPEQIVEYIKQYKTPFYFFKLLRTIYKFNTIGYMDITMFTMYVLTRQYKALGQKIKDFILKNIDKEEDNVQINDVDLELLFSCI
jgi:hypothetical protein